MSDTKRRWNILEEELSKDQPEKEAKNTMYLLPISWRMQWNIKYSVGVKRSLYSHVSTRETRNLKHAGGPS